jgi:DNA segregation ATPase FtsK/SpoIIIE, S-DNA-T family
MDHCDDCGLVYASISTAEIPNALFAFGSEYRRRLTGDPAVLRTRPSPDTWSALEYSCHVRDVLDVQRARLHLALVEDVPTFTPMGRDERAVDDRYNEQAPLDVADQLEQAAAAIAADFAALDDEQWLRTGIYNWPTATERTMTWLGQHTIHEGRHHLLDIDAGLAAIGE